MKKYNFATMLKVKNHIKNLKHVLWEWITLFAFSTCLLKETMFSVVNAEYNQPLNKSKTTTPTNSCRYSQCENQKISVIKQSNIDKQTEPEKVAKNHFFVVRSIGINTYHSKTTSGNSPPK